MEQFTIEESMDAILLMLNNRETYQYSDLQNLVGTKHYQRTSFHDMIHTQIKDGYVEEFPNWKGGSTVAYTLTNNGKIFIRDGGYVKRKEREQEMYKNSTETLSISKQSLFWTKIAVALAVLAILIALFFNQH